MPKTVHGFCGVGKYHEIGVEDDVTAYVEYENEGERVFLLHQQGKRRGQIDLKWSVIAGR